MTEPDINGLSQTDEEAAARFSATRSSDPLPKVLPSLLNTADLLDYIAKTGMIYPFAPSPDMAKSLKPASCAIPFAGRVIWWDPLTPDSTRSDGPRRFDEVLERGHVLKLPRNSIVYLTLEPYFRMPYYIAGRFNLAINQIYRGLLVGTGPLVDPGFQGRLSVPIHNLTGNDYELTAGDPLVWMEFTKVSPHRRWAADARAAGNPYVPFPDAKIRGRRDLDDYLKAASSKPIASSIPEEVGTVKRAADEAKEAANDAAARTALLQKAGVAGAIVAGITVVAAIAALVLPVISQVRDEGKEALRG